MRNHHDHPQAPSGGIGEATDMVKDPVCGMNVDPGNAKHSSGYSGRTYYFCSQACKTKFVADPARFAEAKREAPAADETIDKGTIYTCPMHPEIRQSGPGNCPICGMALEPDVASADSAPNPELADDQALLDRTRA